MYIKRALIIAAHPDDDILGCGGLMSQLKHSVDFKVLFMQKDLLVASQILIQMKLKESLGSVLRWQSAH